jgi:glutathione S-transferase
MQLFYAPQSPFSRKVRAAAIELGLGDRLDLVFAEVVPGRPNEAFARLNPLRKVPALITDAGETIYDSTVICEYLDALCGGGALIPREPPQRWRVLTNHALAQGMCESIILIRYETWLRPEPVRWPVWVDDHWGKIRTGLGWFEANAAELQEPVNLAHLALGCMLGYADFRWPDHGWRRQFPKVGAWFAGIEQRPSFAQTKPEAPPARGG